MVVESNEPAIINIREKDKEIFKRLEESPPFEKKDKKDLFLAAMVAGFCSGIKYEMKKPASGGYFRTSYLNDEEKALIFAIAVKETGELEVLLDKRKVYKIAEEYAAGGIKIIEDLVFGKGSFTKQLESELFKFLKKLKESSKTDMI